MSRTNPSRYADPFATSLPLQERAACIAHDFLSMSIEEGNMFSFEYIGHGDFLLQSSSGGVRVYYYASHPNFLCDVEPAIGESFKVTFASSYDVVNIIVCEETRYLESFSQTEETDYETEALA